MLSSQEVGNVVCRSPERPQSRLSFHAPNIPMITIRILNEAKPVDPETIEEREMEEWLCYQVPKSLLMAKSDVLSNLIDETSQTITLLEMNATVFGIFINYLYTGQVESADGRPLHITNLTYLTQLADRYNVVELSNGMCDLIRAYFAREKGEPLEFRGLWDTGITRLKDLAVDMLFAQAPSHCDADKKFLLEVAVEIHYAEFYYMVIRQIFDREEGLA